KNDRCEGRPVPFGGDARACTYATIALTIMFPGSCPIVGLPANRGGKEKDRPMQNERMMAARHGLASSCMTCHFNRIMRCYDKRRDFSSICDLKSIPFNTLCRI